MRVLVIGAGGMLGHAVFRALLERPEHEVWGTLRSGSALQFFSNAGDRLLCGVDVLDHDAVVKLMTTVKPDVVINCVGLVKQLPQAKSPLVALPINALLPHRLSDLCSLAGARLVHVSTDCVFSGRTGGYREEDVSDAEDVYGRSKYLGEVTDDPCSVTLRTSIIGHELSSRHGLVEWFLSQRGPVPGYSRAIFSGLPTVELARVIREHVLPRSDLSGLFHVGAAPISKLELLRLIASAYGSTTEIIPDDTVCVDRSLNSDRFTEATGYRAPAWPDLIALMHGTRRESHGVRHV